VIFLADAHISVEMVAMIRDLGHDCADSSAIPLRMLDTRLPGSFVTITASSVRARPIR
jgi:hypothetical protein